jgi:EmrB/QacA subfamily drug resistance transporter
VPPEFDNFEAGGRDSGVSRAELAGVVCAAQFMVMVDVAIVNVALPSIHDSLGFSATGLQWVVNAYTLVLAGFLMLGGRACDLLGRRRVFLTGTALFTVSSLVCALADSQGTLVAARAVQGLGGAIISPASLAILSASFPAGHERNRAFGAWAAMSGFGGTVGMLLGGVLTEAFGWPAIFLINLPIGLVVVFLGRRVIPQFGGRDPGRRFDFAGAILITAGLTAIVFGIVRSDALGWGSPGVIVPAIVGVLLLALFVVVEGWLAEDPLVPPRIFRAPLLRAANLVVILLFMGAFSVWFFLSLYMQQVGHFDALEAGLGFAPMTLGVFLSTTLAARAIRRLGVRTVLTGGMVLTGAGLLMLTGVDAQASYFSHVLPGGMVTALGLGFAIVAATIAALEGVPAVEGGLASGILNTSRFIGGSIGLAAFSTLAAAQTHRQLAAGADRLAALTDGYSVAFLAGGLAILVGAALSAALIRTTSAGDRELLDRAQESAVEI